MIITRLVSTIALLFFLMACAGTQKYSPPVVKSSLKNSVTINMSKAELWKKIGPALGKSFFVINNLDKVRKQGSQAQDLSVEHFADQMVSSNKKSCYF